MHRIEVQMERHVKWPPRGHLRPIHVCAKSPIVFKKKFSGETVAKKVTNAIQKKIGALGRKKRSPCSYTKSYGNRYRNEYRGNHSKSLSFWFGFWCPF